MKPDSIQGRSSASSGINLVKIVALALLTGSGLLFLSGLLVNPPQSFRSFISEHAPHWIGLFADGVLLFVLYRVIQKQEKDRLLNQFGSESNAFALDAVRQIRRNGWLTSGTLAGRDFSYADLSKANLREGNLKNCNLNYAQLRDALLYKADLEGADLVAADLYNAELRGANLTRANLRWANLENAVLEGADLSNADLRFAKLDGVVMDTAITKGALTRPVITDEETRLVQETFKILQREFETFTQHFYFRLFYLSPEVKELFLGGMRQQRRKFIQTLETIVSCLNDTNRIVPVIQSLGRSHVTYGVRIAHYDLVRSALLWALRQSLEYEFTPEVQSAWINTYDMIAMIMKDAAEERG